MVCHVLPDGRRFHYELRTGDGGRRAVPWAFLTTVHGDGTGPTVKITEAEALALLEEHGLLD